MVLFQSTVFVFRAGDQYVSVAPSNVLQVLLNVLDREVDRDRAQKRAEAIKMVMKEISFRKASDSLL